jgi:hypothetical protein
MMVVQCKSVSFQKHCMPQQCGHDGGNSLVIAVFDRELECECEGHKTFLRPRLLPSPSRLPRMVAT